MLEIDCPTVASVLIHFIRDSIRKNGFANGIIGVSGGLDSAVVLALTRRALGRAHVKALLMPYRLSNKESHRHGKLICERLGVDYTVVDISPSVDAYFQRFPSDNRLLIGNKCARERMAVLYDFSARQRALVVGTSNKSELLVGYSTQFGDAAAAFMPLGDLYKTQIYQLARHLRIPEEIIAKPPTADLWPGQTDEGEIGVSYRTLDEILYRMIDQRHGEAELRTLGYPLKTVRRIKQMIIRSQFKRTMPPIAKINPRTIGLDFRYPRDWNR